MSLILKQEPANTIATPPAGKSTLFITDTSTMAVKDPSGNVTTFPTVQGSNTQVFFNDNGAINGNASLVFNKTTSTMTVANLSVTGTLNAGDISVSSIANGTSNVDIVGVSGNVSTSVNGTANVIVISTTGATITGNLSASGNINAGNISATTITGSFSGSATTAGTVTTAAQPNITSTGTLASLSVTGNINAGNVAATTFTGALTGAASSATTAGTVTTAAQPNITSTGTLTSVSVTGNVTAGNVIATHYGAATGLTSIPGANVTGTVPSATSATTAGTVTTAAQPNITSVGTLASLSVTATITGSVSGTAATITTAAQPNITSVGTLTSLSVTGNINAGNVTATTFTGALTGLASSATVAASANSVAGANVSGTVSSATTAGTVTTAAQPNITSTGTLTSVSVTGNVTAGNLVTGGILSVTGTGVSSIAGNLNMNTKNITSLATPVNDTDAATKAYVDTVAQGLDTKASVVAATTANITLSGTQTIDGIAVTAGQRVLVKNQSAPADNGLYLCAAGSWTRTTDMTTWAQVPGAYVFVEGGTTQADTGWVCTSDAGGTIGVTAMTWAQFSGAGSYTAGTGLTLTGSVFSVNVAQPTITSVGTLASLSVSGNANVGNIGAVAGVFTGNVTVGNIVSSGSGGNITGANVISANTFSASGNISAGNISATTFTGALSGAATTAGTVTTAAQPNITSVGTLSTLSVTATITGSVSGTAATVTTAAQPNITSLGTMTGMSYANASTITGNNITFSTGANTNLGTFTGNFSLSAGSRLNATYADLAEKYVADAEYQPGTVLVFGGEQEVTLSTESDSFRVAGVVTTNPAYTMNNECEGEHVATIALQGRAPVKVTGPVYKGDLLVSSTNGHATANNIARAGTIIGKSLENFNGESGIIEVAVGRF